MVCTVLFLHFPSHLFSALWFNIRVQVMTPHLHLPTNQTEHNKNVYTDENGLAAAPFANVVAFFGFINRSVYSPFNQCNKLLFSFGHSHSAKTIKMFSFLFYFLFSLTVLWSLKLLQTISLMP